MLAPPLKLKSWYTRGFCTAFLDYFLPKQIRHFIKTTGSGALTFDWVFCPSVCMCVGCSQSSQCHHKIHSNGHLAEIIILFHVFMDTNHLNHNLFTEYYILLLFSKKGKKPYNKMNLWKNNFLYFISCYCSGSGTDMHLEAICFMLFF